MGLKWGHACSEKEELSGVPSEGWDGTVHGVPGRYEKSLKSASMTHAGRRPKQSVVVEDWPLLYRTGQDSAALYHCTVVYLESIKRCGDIIPSTDHNAQRTGLSFISF